MLGGLGLKAKNFRR